MPSVLDYLKKKMGIGEYSFKGFKPGYLYTYKYFPKYADFLDFYDTQPLIIFIENAPGGWYGLNIHFLPQKMRDKIFTQINMKLEQNKNLDIRPEIWKRLQIIKGYEHKLLRRYLKSHIKSRITPIPVDKWSDFKNFPTEKFYGLTSTQIFNITLKG